MKNVRSILLALVVLALASSPALAWGGLRLSTPLTDRLAAELSVGDLGDALYEAQEGVHDVVTDATGVEVPHDYVDVCLGDECIPVDPIRFSN